MSVNQLDGYLAVPPSGAGRPVLVLHAWWGLNDTIKAFCDRLAQAGFVVYALDLYHGKIAETIAEAEALGQALDARADQAVDDIAAAVRFLAHRSGPDGHNLAVIGFSLGAYYALEISAQDPDHIRSVVVFYGTGETDLSRSQAAYLGHFAADDPYEPPENVQALEDTLRSAGRPVTFYTYPSTGHWFFESDRSAYNEQAAALAWERTLAFLQRPPA